MSPITVLVMTSPIPSNPDTSIIEETINSATERLPDARVIVTCDGVRPEQEHRREVYQEFLRNLSAARNKERGIVVHAPEFWHQSGMLKAAIPAVQTPFVLVMEHDTPLVDDIPFDQIISTMEIEVLNSVRFMHETHIQEGHEQLFLQPVRKPGLAPYCPTIQWSQRPALVRTRWYQMILDSYFGTDSRTFLEDQLHGIVQHDKQGSALNPQGAFKRWRMAVYAPEGSWKRSTHTDGRGDDPKYPVRFSYDGERPSDAPPEGWYDA